MLLAHLRGLLKPYYVQGARSIFAERLMLRTLAAEIESDYESRFMIMQSSFAPLTSGNNAQNMWAEMAGGFSGVVDRALLEFSRTPARVSRDAKGLVALFNSLVSSGFFDRLNEASEEALRDHPMRRN
jgi:hypothetical protein